MTLNIQLPPEAAARLRERAAAEGQDVAAYATRLLRDAIATPSVDELLAPFRRQVEESRMNDDQLDAFYDDLRNKAAAARAADKHRQP